MTVASSETSWYVAQTQPHKELTAAAHLKRQGFSVYLPRYLKRRRHARRTETVARPLFPNYIFVAVDLKTQRWRAINSTTGVLRLVCNGDAPAPVPPEVMDAIKGREGANGFIWLDQRSRFNTGDKVRILNGVFSVCDGLFECVIDRDRVAILLDLLGRKVRLVIDDGLISAA